MTATNRIELCADCMYPDDEEAERLCEGMTVTHFLVAFSDLGLDPSQLIRADDVNAA
ncbi:hypothetical protein [Rhodococcus sp. 5G237]